MGIQKWKRAPLEIRGGLLAGLSQPPSVTLWSWRPFSPWNRDMDLWGESTFKDILVTFHLWGSMTELVLQGQKKKVATRTKWCQRQLLLLSNSLPGSNVMCSLSITKPGRRDASHRESSLITGPLNYSIFFNFKLSSKINSVVSFWTLRIHVAETVICPSKIYSSLP